jgi:hypothetical protein
MLDRMRGTDEHARLRARAEDKHARIAMAADLPHVEEFSPLQLLQLRDWYFSQVLGWDMPDDLEQRARAWGYCGLPDFHRAIFAEYVYRQMTDAADMARRAATGEAQPDAT